MSTELNGVDLGSHGLAFLVTCLRNSAHGHSLLVNRPYTPTHGPQNPPFIGPVARAQAPLSVFPRSGEYLRENTGKTTDVVYNTIAPLYNRAQRARRGNAGQPVSMLGLRCSVPPHLYTPSQSRSTPALHSICSVCSVCPVCPQRTPSFAFHRGVLAWS